MVALGYYIFNVISLNKKKIILILSSIKYESQESIVKNK